MTLQDVTFTQFQNFLIFELKQSEKPSTLAPRKYIFNQIKGWFDSKPFTRDIFREFLMHQKSRGLGNSTVNKQIAVAKNIAQLLNVKEFEEITYFEEQRRVKKDALTWEEINKLSSVVIDYGRARTNFSEEFKDRINFKYSCLIRFLAQTGCRIGEALGLLWTDIDNNIVTFQLTKNGKDREVVISPQLASELQMLPHGEAKVFARTSLSSFDNDLKRRAQAIKLKKTVHAHLFRHSVITNLAKSGAPLAVLRDLVGHESLETTSRYCHTKLDEIEQMLACYSGAWEKNLSRSLLTKQIKNYLQTMMGESYEKVRYEEDDKFISIRIPKVLFNE